jgi:hypothetical protein
MCISPGYSWKAGLIWLLGTKSHVYRRRVADIPMHIPKKKKKLAGTLVSSPGSVHHTVVIRSGTVQPYVRTWYVVRIHAALYKHFNKKFLFESFIDVQTRTTPKK